MTWLRLALVIAFISIGTRLTGTAFAAGTDCPMARTPYSAETPLIDLLIDPRTKSVLDRELGAALSRMPPRFVSPTPPSFAAIITARELLAMTGRKDAAAVLGRIDAGVKTVPLTPAAILTRCARYDLVRPTLPATLPRPAILVFDKITGFRDTPSVDAATVALKAMAARRGWTLVFSDNGAVFGARDLARFDAVVWNNVSGDALTMKQRKAFRAYIAKGGGFAGFHGSAGDPHYIWEWYADTLIGARFIGHPMGPQFQAARVVVDDPANAITRDMSTEWTMTEEWYSFARSPRLNGAHVLATLNETSYTPRGLGGQDLRMGDHPIAWTRCIGDGRSFYSAIGHRPESYSQPQSLRLLEQGIAWAAGRGETSCRRGVEGPRG